MKNGKMIGDLLGITLTDTEILQLGESKVGIGTIDRKAAQEGRAINTLKGMVPQKRWFSKHAVTLDKKKYQ